MTDDLYKALLFYFYQISVGAWNKKVDKRAKDDLFINLEWFEIKILFIPDFVVTDVVQLLVA